MNNANNRWLAVKQLDRQLKKWQAVSHEYGSPRAGWVKTLRKTLGITASQLAARLGLSSSRISQLEKAEIEDAVTLHALRNAAHGMGCELVYAFIPKDQTSLENLLAAKAEQIAEDKVARVAHSMSLEAQTVDPEILKEQKKQLVKNLTDHFTIEKNDDHSRSRIHSFKKKKSP